MKVIEEVHQDPKLKEIISVIQQGQEAPKGYSYIDGVLLYKGEIGGITASP